mmetsp:Transcript_26316/g.47527  ORF Transcript_26316/g.47527 Transcript_26316/m.47527 type:complete len:169 (+) Transcript_26316:303-809(+)
MRRYQLEEIKIEKANGQTVEVQFGVGCELVARQVEFEIPEDALRFHSVVQKVTQLERDRGKCQLEKYRLSQENLASIKYSDHIQVFVEIVSITDIPKDVAPMWQLNWAAKCFIAQDMHIVRQVVPFILSRKDAFSCSICHCSSSLPDGWHDLPCQGSRPRCCHGGARQ